MSDSSRSTTGSSSLNSLVSLMYPPDFAGFTEADIKNHVANSTIQEGPKLDTSRSSTSSVSSSQGALGEQRLIMEPRFTACGALSVQSQFDNMLHCAINNVMQQVDSPERQEKVREIEQPVAKSKRPRTG